jgi:hypothetical protein
MAIPVQDTICKNIRGSPSVRATKSDETKKDIARNPAYIYIGTYSLRILVPKSIRANKPSNMIIQVIKKLGLVKRYNDRAR